MTWKQKKDEIWTCIFWQPVGMVDMYWRLLETTGDYSDCFKTSKCDCTGTVPLSQTSPGEHPGHPGASSDHREASDETGRSSKWIEVDRSGSVIWCDLQFLRTCCIHYISLLWPLGDHPGLFCKKPVTAGRPSGGPARSQKSNLTFQVSSVFLHVQWSAFDLRQLFWSCSVCCSLWRLETGAWCLIVVWAEMENGFLKNFGAAFCTKAKYWPVRSLLLSCANQCVQLHRHPYQLDKASLNPWSSLFLPQYPAKLRSNEESAQLKQLSRELQRAG